MMGPNEPRPPRPTGAVGDEVPGNRRKAARNPGTPERPESPDTDSARTPVDRDHAAAVGTETENESDESLEH